MKSLSIDLDTIKIKPITNEYEFKETSNIDDLVDSDMIEEVKKRQKALETLNTITTLAIEYAKKHYPVPAPDPIEAIKQRIEMLNLSQKDVAKYFG